VINNTCYNNDGDGISLNGFSDNSEVINNNCFSNGGRGLYIRLSSNTILKDNTCKENSRGISFYGSYSSTVINNTVSHNSGGFSYGIRFSDANDYVPTGPITLTNNTVNNNDWGIMISSTKGHNSSLNGNLIQGNRKYGILIDSDNNHIYQNYLYNNSQDSGTSQARDDGFNNTWYGNYWSDYGGAGVYLLDGLSGSVDPIPVGYKPINTNASSSRSTSGFSVVSITSIFVIVQVAIIYRKHDRF
jgi:parallel beta-helix repeat protein